MSAFEESGALVPSLEPLVPEDVEETQEEQQEYLNTHDEALASLVFSPGYKVLEDKLQGYIDGLSSGKSVNIDEKDTFEIIGQKYMVARGVADICQELLNTVTSASQAVADREIKRRAKRQRQAEE